MEALTSISQFFGAVNQVSGAENNVRVIASYILISSNRTQVRRDKPRTCFVHFSTIFSIAYFIAGIHHILSPINV